MDLDLPRPDLSKDHQGRTDQARTDLSQSRLPNIHPRPPVYGRQQQFPESYQPMAKHIKDYESDEEYESESSEDYSTLPNEVPNKPDSATRQKNFTSRNESSESFSAENLSRVVLFVIVALIAVFIVWRPWQYSSCENEIDCLKNQMLALHDKFPSQNKTLWYSISAAIKELREKPPIPLVFVLLHNNNKNTSFCLARHVGTEVIQFLKKQHSEPIIIEGENLQNNVTLHHDYGTFIKTYKQDIEENHVMIINGLEKVPGSIAQTFHSLCDSDNPLVGTAAYFFTLEFQEIGNASNPTEIAELTLRSLWKETIERDIMEPLIMRITNVVYTINLETNLPC